MLETLLFCPEPVANVLFQLLVHFFESSAVDISHIDKVFPCIKEFTTLDIFNVILLCQSPKKHLGDRRAKHDRLRIMYFGDLADVLFQIING